MEYAGFVPVEGIDISGLTQKVSDKIFDIGEERKKKKQDLEDLTQKMMDESAIEMTDNNVINDKIAKFTEQYQNAIHENHKKLTSGQMSPSEYQRYMETAKRNIDAYAKSANSLDETIAKQAERIRKGEAGALQAEQIANLERIVSLENNQRVDENGRLVIDMPDGRVVAVDALTKPGMFISRRIDLQGDLDESMKKWDANGMWSKFGIGGIEKWESLRDNDAYDLAKKKLALSMVSGDGMQSVLLDHGGIEGPVYVYSKVDAEKAIQEEIDRLSKLKEGKEITEEELEEIRNKVVLMDSKGKPVFTEEQEKKALDLVQNAIDMRAAEKANLTVTKPFDSRSGQKKETPGQIGKKEKAGAIYKAASRAMQSDPFDKSAMNSLNKFAADRGKEAGVEYRFKKETKRNPVDGQFGIIVTTYDKVLEMPNINSEQFKKSAEYKDAVTQGKQKKIEDGKEVERTDRDRQTLIDGAYTRFSKDESNKVYVDKLQDTQRLTKTVDLMKYLGSKNPFDDYDTGLELYPNYESDLKRYMSEYYYKTKNAGGTPVIFEEWLKGTTTQGTTTETTTKEKVYKGLDENGMPIYEYK